MTKIKTASIAMPVKFIMAAKFFDAEKSLPLQLCGGLSQHAPGSRRSSFFDSVTGDR
jgi:hypothetical protein